VDKIIRLWSLVVYVKGKSKYNKGIPNLIVFRGSKSRRSNIETFGEYYHNDNVIKIWCGPHINFSDFASTILHEYSHYLQFWPWYTRYRKMYTYEKNPYEIEAKESEKYAQELIKRVSEKEWKKFTRGNQKILEIYEETETRINIKY